MDHVGLSASANEIQSLCFVLKDSFFGLNKLDILQIPWKNVILDHFYEIVVVDDDDDWVSFFYQILHINSKMLVPFLIDAHDIVFHVEFNIEHSDELIPFVRKFDDRTISNFVKRRIRLKWVNIHNIWGFHHDRLEKACSGAIAYY